MPSDRRWLAPIGYGAWFGLASGFAETLVRLFRWTASGRSLELGSYVLWMPACVNLVLFLGLGLALAAVARALPRGLPPRLVLTLLAAVALLDPLWIFSPPLHIYAVLALAAGGGVQAGRLLAPRLAGFDRTVRRTLPLLAATVLVTALGIEAARRLHETRTLAAAPAAAAGRPNVLLLVLDTVRSMNLSLYGYFRPTSPEIARLAAGGVTFNHAVSTAPWTLPSHGSMFTGRWPHEQSSGWRSPLDGTWPTLAEVLNREGYATAGFVANYAYCDRQSGLARGFGHYEDYPLTWKQVLISSKLGLWVARRPMVAQRLGPASRFTPATASKVSTAFLDWSAGHTDRPYFAFINFLDAHSDYYSPPEFRELYRSDSAQAPPRPVHVREIPAGEADMRAQPIEDYDRAITYIDREIGRIMAELERRGELAHTLVIVTADHGEEFWEHGLIGHGKNLYHTSLAVPLVMALPGRLPAGRAVSPVVSLRNLAATIMDLSGATSTAPFPGQSLARFWDDPTGAAGSVPDTAIAEVDFAWGGRVSKGDMRSIYSDSLHLIDNGDDTEEVYDVARDRWEQSPMSTSPGVLPAADTLRARLAALPPPPENRRHVRRRKGGQP